MEFNQKSTDILDIVEEMVRIQRKTMKEIALELDTIDKMVKDMRSDRQSYNICGIRNQRSYELETMPAKEYRSMIQDLVNTIYEYCGDRYTKKADILKECYKRMDREYSAGLNQKRIEFIKQNGYAPYSTLEMISEFYNEYLIYKTVLLSMLEKMVSDIWVTPEQTITIPNNRKKKKLRKGTLNELCKVSTWEDAQDMMQLLNHKIGNNNDIDRLYDEIYRMMDKENVINWTNYRYRIRKSKGLDRTDEVTKKNIIDFSQKLQKQFVKQFNLLLEEKIKNIS